MRVWRSNSSAEARLVGPDLAAGDHDAAVEKHGGGVVGAAGRHRGTADWRGRRCGREGGRRGRRRRRRGRRGRGRRRCRGRRRGRHCGHERRRGRGVGTSGNADEQRACSRGRGQARRCRRPRRSAPGCAGREPAPFRRWRDPGGLDRGLRSPWGAGAGRDPPVQGRRGRVRGTRAEPRGCGERGWSPRGCRVRVHGLTAHRAEGRTRGSPRAAARAGVRALGGVASHEPLPPINRRDAGRAPEHATRGKRDDWPVLESSPSRRPTYAGCPHAPVLRGWALPAQRAGVASAHRPVRRVALSGTARVAMLTESAAAPPARASVARRSLSGRRPAPTRQRHRAIRGGGTVTQGLGFCEFCGAGRIMVAQARCIACGREISQPPELDRGRAPSGPAAATPHGADVPVPPAPEVPDASSFDVERPPAPPPWAQVPFSAAQVPAARTRPAPRSRPHRDRPRRGRGCRRWRVRRRLSRSGSPTIAVCSRRGSRLEHRARDDLHLPDRRFPDRRFADFGSDAVACADPGAGRHAADHDGVPGGNAALGRRQRAGGRCRGDPLPEVGLRVHH